MPLASNTFAFIYPNMEGVYIDLSNIISTIRTALREELQLGLNTLLAAQAQDAQSREAITQLLTLHEVRAILKVSRGTIYKLISSDQLTPIKISGKLLFEKANVIALINHSKSINLF